MMRCIKSKKVLFLRRSGELMASSQYRIFKYLPSREDI